MDKEMFEKLKRSVVKHEGKSNFPYHDTVGKITIGIGYDLTDRGISDDWIDTQFDNDSNYFYECLCKFPWYLKLNTDRQIALIDMCFMGFKKFLNFKKLIKSLENEDNKTAAQEILNSNWAAIVGKEKGQRAYTIAQVILTGVYDI